MWHTQTAGLGSQRWGTPCTGFHCKNSSHPFLLCNFTANFQHTLQLRLEQPDGANFSSCYGISAIANLHFYIIESSSFASFRAAWSSQAWSLCVSKCHLCKVQYLLSNQTWCCVFLQNASGNEHNWNVSLRKKCFPKGEWSLWKYVHCFSKGTCQTSDDAYKTIFYLSSPQKSFFWG